MNNKKILSEQFENKTINFYLDKNEVRRAGDAVIEYVNGQGEDIVLVVKLMNDIKLKNKSFRKGDKFGIKYSCSHTKMTPLKGGFMIDKHLPLGKTSFQPIWEDTGFLYNSQLANELAKKFCAVSKGGTPVPKRDYSMTNQEPAQAMTEGKRVVRLTEADLIRLVKKVLIEQSNPPMGDEQKKAVEKCFMENLDMNDLSKVPTCSALAFEMLKTKRLPTDMQKGMKCANEISVAVGDDPFTAFAKLTQVGQCLIGQSVKPPSPVRF